MSADRPPWVEGCEIQMLLEQAAALRVDDKDAGRGAPNNRLLAASALLSVFAYLSGLGALGVFSGSAHALARRGYGLSGRDARR